MTEDKTGQLIDMVCKKGERASNNLFDILERQAPDIFKSLPLGQEVVGGRKCESWSHEIVLTLLSVF